MEGDVTSLDMPIYSACYPGWKVAPRGGHEKVQEAVRALNDNDDLHWMEVVGIIDGDGRYEDEINALKLKKIIVLPLPSIENLFFVPEVVKQVAKILEKTFGNNCDQTFAAANQSVAGIIERDKLEICAKRTMWITNRQLAQGKVSTDDIRSGILEIPKIDVAAIKETVEQSLSKFLQNSPSLETLKDLPIKNTGIPAQIAQAIGLPLKKYKQTVLYQIEIESVEGKKMRQAISKFLPVLP